jgi:cell division protein FtsI/penicillin-binding protein 2
MAAVAGCCASLHASTLGTALADALGGTQASAVVVDQRTGAVLASSGDARRGAPGSAIKPLLLEYALEHGIMKPDTEVYCRRDLRVGGRLLACTHPADQVVFTAESALAESCNTWFAEMARRFSSTQLEEALERTHFSHAQMQVWDVEQRQLAVLGLEGVSASPLELARAYRDMLEHLPADSSVARGLQDSVNFGMAHPAEVAGVNILGKTGTARNAGETWTHGWFAGAIRGRFVVVIYVPRGDGGTAALLAHKFFVTASAEGLLR